MIIRNKTTGEVKEIAPEEATQYGVSAPKGNILDTVSDFFLKRTKDVVSAATGALNINRDTVQFAKDSEEAFNRSRELIKQAQLESDPIKKKELLDKSRQIDFGIDEKSTQLSNTISNTMRQADISENDLTKSNLQFAAERGAGVAGEVGALLMPFSAEAKALSAAAKTANLFQKMVASGIISSASAGLLGVTDPKAEGFVDRVEKGTIDALKGFATAAVLTGGIEVAKEGLKIGGKIVKSFFPKDVSSRIFSGAFGVPSKLNDRLKPIETSDEIADMGIWGSFDDLKTTGEKVTGENGILPKVNREVMGRLRTPIDTGAAQSAASDALDDAILVGDKEGKKALQQIAKILTPRQGEGIGTKQALDAFDAQRKLEEIGYNYLNKSTALSPNITNEQLGRIYLNAADALADQIDKASLAEGVLDTFKTPEMLASLSEISPKLADKFVAAKTVADLRALQKPFVRLMQMIDLTDAYKQSGLVQSIGRSAGLGRTVLNATLNNPVVRTGAAQIVNRIENVGAAGQAATSSLPQVPPNILELLVGMSQR